MSDSDNTNGPDKETLLKKIQTLETRLSRIESVLRMEWDTGAKKAIASSGVVEEDVAESTESRIVESGLAWLGSIVLLFGIVFLKSYIGSLGYPVLSVVIALTSAIVLVLISFLLRKSFSILFNVVNICVPLLIYYIAAGLHFFTAEPLIAQKGIVLILLLLIAGLQLYNAIQKKSEFLGFIALTFGIITAMLADSALITFVILTISAIGAYLLFYYNLWWRLIIYTLLNGISDPFTLVTW